ncbi:hypothetical protein [Streptomyces enissocaesilis]|uniref:Uncharacterized protein n=1 Tax=Streptomyces enissocaesilis TaxID=332589 RepID=A0ABP6K3K2_9ACTN
MHVSEWLPDQPIRIGRIDWPEEADDGTHLRLRAGHIVVVDRQPWRILEIHGYRDPWPKSYEKAWRDHVELWKHSESLHRANGQPATEAPARADFYKRPIVLVLRNENLPRSAPKHWCAPASHDWQVLPEHYSVCRACGELPPCHNGEYRWEGGPRRPEHNGGVTLIVPPDCCIGCAEHIKPRMRTVRFPGPNLWYPDREDGSAVFHARTACADQVDCYRAQWMAEYPPAMSQPVFALGLSDSEGFVLPRARPAHSAQPADWNHPAADGAETRRSGLPEVRHEPPAGGTTLFEQAVPRLASETSHANHMNHADQVNHANHMSHANHADHMSHANHADQMNHANHVSHANPASAAPFAAPAHQGPVGSQERAGYEEPGVRPVTRMHHSSPIDHPDPESPPRPAPSVDAAAPMISLQNIEAVRRLTEELGLTQVDRSALHDADQAAKVIEELTAAVRNVALCLRGTGLRIRS